MNELTKSGKFLEAINRFAQERQQKLQDEVTAYKEQRVEQATEEGLRDAYELIQHEIAEQKSEIVRETARIEQQERSALYLARKKMTDTIFERAKERLTAFCATPEYDDKLVECAEKIRDYLGSGKVTVYLAPHDMEKADRIATIFGGCSVQPDDEIMIGGMRVSCADSGVIVDETYDSKLRDERLRFVESAPMKVV